MLKQKQMQRVPLVDARQRQMAPGLTPATQAATPATPQPLVAGARVTLPPRPPSMAQVSRQAAVLQRATNGRPARAGGALLQMQRQYGNRYVQRVVAHATGSAGRQPNLALGPTQRQTPSAPDENRTGLPDALKAGLEQLSGLDLSGVRVHYNSAKPAHLNALAYAQGQVIEVGPGQARHLPHEGWHVVQQMQGRVLPTMELMENVSVNDDVGLEKEADIKGREAFTTGQNLFFWRGECDPDSRGDHELIHIVQHSRNTVQRAPHPPEMADTKGLYNAQQNSKKEEFKGTSKKPQFGAKLYAAVLLTFQGGQGTTVTAAGKEGLQALTPETTQLDHNPSWDIRKTKILNYATEMTGRFKKEELTPEDSSLITNGYYERKLAQYAPTVYGARMYYNDYDTLRPATPGANASAGASSVQYGATGTFSEELNKDYVLRRVGDYSLAFYAGLDIEEGGTPESITNNIGAFIDKLTELKEQLNPQETEVRIKRPRRL